MIKVIKNINNIRLFVDDDIHAEERIRLSELHESTHWATNMNDAIEILSSGNVVSISLDHDLGNESDGVGNGKMVAQWILNAALDGKIPPLAWGCHSFNPIGVGNIIRYMQDADKVWKMNGLPPIGKFDLKNGIITPVKDYRLI